MKFNGILTLVVTVLAVVLISTACIIPIVENAQSEIRTNVNNSDFTFAMANGAVEIVTVPAIAVNGYAITDSRVVIAVGDDFTIYRYTAGVNLKLADSETVIKSASIANGTISYVASDDTTGTHTFTGMVYYASEKGDYALYNDVATNIPKGSTVYGFIDRDFTDGTNTIRFQASFVGTLEDGFSVYAKSVSTNPIKYLDEGSVSIVYEENETYNSISATPPIVTLTDGGTTYTSASNAAGVVKFQYMAPLSYQIITDNDSSIISLLGIIPMLLFVIPIMLVVRGFGVGRD